MSAPPFADPIREAHAHLGAALSQALPSDDQIIIGHMREAHALLGAELRARTGLRDDARRWREHAEACRRAMGSDAAERVEEMP